MHARCQESYKHSIPPQPTLDLYRPVYPHPARPTSPPEPSNCRINITFRFYRPDFHARSTPRCKCGVPTILRPDMKNRHDGRTDRYWWVCYAGAQNDGKGCDFWKVMDMVTEGRGSAFANSGQVKEGHQIAQGTSKSRHFHSGHCQCRHSLKCRQYSIQIRDYVIGHPTTTRSNSL